MLAKVMAAATAVIVPVWGARTWIENRFSKKADKHTVNNDFHRVETEQALHREYFKDVFNKLEEHARRDEDHFTQIERKSEERHRELMMHLLERRG